MRKLTAGELNRTYLERQWLLEPSALPASSVIEQVVGLQAQVVSPPYYGLWSRMREFAPADLMTLRDSRQVVRAAMLRSTLHWVRREDFFWMRPLLQPALEKAWQGFFGVRKSGIEVEPLCAAAKDALRRGPISLNVLSDELLKHFPKWNKEAMEYGVRTHLPLVQVSPAGTFKGGTAAKYVLEKVAAKPDVKQMVRRYLAAFGPASARDIAAWAGFTAIGKTMEAMRDELATYSDEAGRVLYDVPGLAIADAKRKAPVRFAAEYDNLVLSHADRSRVLREEHRKRVLLSAGRVMATVLVDGFAAGVWKIERDRKAARLNVELFAEPTKKLLREVEAEGRRVLEFGDADSPSRAVEVRWIV